MSEIRCIWQACALIVRVIALINDWSLYNPNPTPTNFQIFQFSIVKPNRTKITHKNKSTTTKIESLYHSWTNFNFFSKNSFSKSLTISHNPHFPFLFTLPSSNNSTKPTFPNFTLPKLPVQIWNDDSLFNNS